jgi:hypothetical protein
MNKKVGAVAAILLAVALILPFYVLLETTTADLEGLAHRGPLLDETQIESYFQETAVAHQRLYIILGVTEAVLVILFAIAFWLIIRH